MEAEFIERLPHQSSVGIEARGATGSIEDDHSEAMSVHVPTKGVTTLVSTGGAIRQCTPINEGLACGRSEDVLSVRVVAQPKATTSTPPPDLGRRTRFWKVMIGSAC